MKIISLINSKGGVGKTTLATHIASYLSINTSANVLLVDADEQGSVRDWQEVGKQTAFSIIGADRANLLTNLKSTLSHSNYGYVIIDTPGHAMDITAIAISMSDLCLIPVCPSSYDLWATEDIVKLITIRQTVTDGKPLAFYVINLAKPETNICKEVCEYLGDSDVDVIGKPITNRNIYKETAKIGRTVLNTNKNQEAIEEITILCQALLFQLHNEEAI